MSAGRLANARMLTPVKAPQRRVLHLTGMTATKYGSMEKYLLRIVSECSRRGFRSVIQYESPPRSAAFLRDAEAVGAELFIVTTSSRSLGDVRNVTRLVRSLRPAVVHSHFLERHALLAAALAARSTGVRRVIAMVHNVHHLTPGSYARIAYNRCDPVLAVSEAVHRDLLQGGVVARKIHTQYLGLVTRDEPTVGRHASRRLLNLPDGAPVLCNIAFDAPFKGVDVLVRAFKRVLTAYPEALLVQVGVDPSESRLPSLAVELGIAERVRWVGVTDDAWALLSSADLYVQPSRWGEGLPLAIMEAMASRLPVVATAAAGNAEAVADGVSGLLAKPDSEEALASVLIRALSQRDQWEKWGDAGYARYRDLFDATTSIPEMIQRFYGTEAL